MIAKVSWDINYNAHGSQNRFRLSAQNCFRNLSIKYYQEITLSEVEKNKNVNPQNYSFSISE